MVKNAYLDQLCIKQWLKLIKCLYFIIYFIQNIEIWTPKIKKLQTTFPPYNQLHKSSSDDRSDTATLYHSISIKQKYYDYTKPIKYMI